MFESGFTMLESPEFMKRAGLHAIAHAEDFYSRGFIDMAISSINAAKHLNPELSGKADSFLVAYKVQRSAPKGEERWYEILGVEDVKASVEDVKRRYRKMALSVHPDKNGSVAAENAFKNVGNAWELLSNEVKRTAYDYKMGYISAPSKPHQQQPSCRSQPAKAQRQRTSSEPLQTTKTSSSHHQAAGAKRPSSQPDQSNCRAGRTSAKRPAYDRNAMFMFATAMKIISDEAIDIADMKIQFEEKMRCRQSQCYSSKSSYARCARAMKMMYDEADINDIKFQFEEKIRYGKAY